MLAVMKRVFSYALAAAACALAAAGPVPARTQTASSARELYLKAIAVMEHLKQPPFVTYHLESKSDGLKGELSDTCHPCMPAGNNVDHWMLWHRTWDYTTAILDESNGARYVAHNASMDPTWYGTARALHTGMIHGINAYTIPEPSAHPIDPRATPAPDTALKTISLISDIGPGIYNIEDRGSAACSNGDPGRALHLWSRERNQGHQLSDVIVDLQSMRFCMMRFGMSAAGPMGGNAYAEEHFGDVGGYWVETDGFVDGTLRVFGIKAMHGRWYYRLTDMQFPAALPDSTFTEVRPAFDAGVYMHAQRLVDIGGRRLNLYCTGSGSPAVLLDAGGGDDTLDWRFVQPLLAQHSRVCSYDRAGLGFSDPGPLPRDAAANAADLHALVTAAGIAPPFVLVGYSSSTLAARIYADRYPNDLAGLVLVEPDIEDRQPALLAVAPALRPVFAQAEAEQNACAVLEKCPIPPNPMLPADLDAVQLKQMERPQAEQDVRSENATDSTASTREVRGEQRNYGALPLLVLTAEDVFPAGSYLPDDQRRAERAFIDKLRAPLTNYSKRGSLVQIAGCSHEDITIDCAADVASAIEKML
jgi:pimeloyl-ACP methyl ester carboxylesterase